MTEPRIIENIKRIVTGRLGSADQIVTVTVENLTAPGDHYLSTMLRADVSLASSKRLALVAKCAPRSEFARPGFAGTFASEQHFYASIVPTMRAFLREEGASGGWEMFPEYIGSVRNSVGEGGEVDESAVLVLENLRSSGYTIQNRLKGLDLDSTRLVLRDLAEFHAVPLALKLKRPQLFKEVIGGHSGFKIKLPPGERNPFLHGISVVRRIIERYPDISDNAPVIESKLIDYTEDLSARSRLATEPWGTLSHFDMWTNNTMQKFVDGRPASNKFVDFQMYLYESPANDLLFFLISSVDLSSIRHIDDLIDFYHGNFIETLASLGCDVSPFGREEFSGEVGRVAEMELLHVLLMSFVIYADKGAVGPNQLPGAGGKEEDFCQAVKDRLAFIVRLGIQRKWLLLA